MTRRSAEEKPFGHDEASLERAGRVEDLIRLYETRARDRTVPSDAARLLIRAADLAHRRLKDHARAEGLLRQALLVVPDERNVLRELRLLYEQMQEHGALAEVLERLGATSTGEESAAFYLRAAEVYETRLNRRDRAALCCQLAIKSDPKNRSAFRFARALHLQDGRISSAFDLLERERSALGGQGLVDEYVAIAERLLDEPDEHALALRALDIAAQLDSGHARAAKIRAHLSQLPGHWADRVRELKALAGSERDRKAAARAHLSVAKLLAHFDPKAQPKVQEALDRAFLLWPAMPEALAFLERLAEREQRLADAVAHYERAAAEHAERNTRVDLYVRAGMLRLSRLCQPEPALADFEKAAAIDPSRGDATSLAFELLFEQGRFAEGAALLERHLATLRDRAHQLELRWTLAELCEERLSDTERARAHLEAMLALDPRHAEAAYALIRLSVREGKLDGIAAHLAAALEANRPEQERVELCAHVAELARRCGQVRLAAEALARGIAIEPSRLEWLHQVMALAKEGGASAELVMHLKRAADGAPADAAIELYRAVAHLAGPGEAAHAWQKVLERAPKDAEALAALESSRPLDSADRRIHLETELQRLAGGGEAAEIAAACRELLALAPNHVKALEQLFAAAATLGRWDEAANVAERLAELTPGPERQKWRAALAQLLADRLERQNEAASLSLELLAEGHATEPVVRMLERLAASGVRREEIAEALVPHYARQGDHQRAAATLLLRLEAASGVGERKGLIRQLAELYEHRLADGRAALSMWLRGVMLDPADPAFRRETTRLARELIAHGELAACFTDAALRTADVALALPLLCEAADIADEGGAVEAAERALSVALGLAPADTTLLDRLVALYTRARRRADAEAVLRRAIEVARPRERPRLFTRLADLYAESSNLPAAVAAYEDAIRAGGDEPQLLLRLCELFERLKQPAHLAEALERLAVAFESRGDPARAADARMRQGRVRGSMGDQVSAAKSYADVLARRPTDEKAIAALEAMLDDPTCRDDAARALIGARRASGDHAGLIALLETVASWRQGREKAQLLSEIAELHARLGHTTQAFAALARALAESPDDRALRSAARAAAEAQDALDSYAEILDELLERVPASTQVAFHRELAEIREKLGDRASALEHYRAVSGADPHDVEVLRALQRLYRAGNEWASLADVTERLAVALSDPAERAAACREAAALYEQRLWDKERAIACWRQLAQLSPLDREAASAMDRLAVELRRPQDLAFALELERAQEASTPRWRDLTVRLAVLKNEKLGDVNGAIALLSEVLEQDPTHSPALEALAAWAEAPGEAGARSLKLLDAQLARAGQHDRRVSLREVRLRVADDAEKMRLATELIRLCEVDLGNKQRAFMAALRCFAAGCESTGLAPALERLALETDAVEELAEIFESTADERMPGEATASLLRRAARLREHLGQAEAAERLWKALLKEVPGDAEALEHLARLYERTRNGRALAEVYARQAELAAEPAERAALLLKAAVAREEAGELEKALEHAASAAGLRSSVESLTALERLYGKLKRFPEQAGVLEHLASMAQGEERRILLLRRARLLEKEGLGQAALAAYEQAMDASADPEVIAGLERLLERDDVRVAAARLLERIFRQRNDSNRLAAVLELLVDDAPAQKRPALLREIASLREAQGDASGAFMARMKAFVERPDDAVLRDELERAAEAAGAIDELAAAYEDVLDRIVRAERAHFSGETTAPTGPVLDDALAVALLSRLAKLYADRLGRPDLAVRACEDLARRRPGDLPAGRALADAYRRTGAVKPLCEVLLRLAGLERSAEAQVELYFEAAQLAEDALSDKGLAARCYEQVLALAPEDLAAIRSLEKLYAESRRYEELARLLERESRLVVGEERVELMVRLARLKLGRLGEAKSALAIVEQLLSIDPPSPLAMELLDELSRSDAPDVRARALELLEPRLEERSRLAELLEAQIAQSTSTAERTALLKRIARIREDEGELELAFFAAARALRESPGDDDALSACVRTAAACGAEEELRELLAQIGPGAKEKRPAVYRALARLCLDAHDLPGAAAAHEAVLDADPADLASASALEELYVQLGRWDDLVALLLERLRDVKEPMGRRSLLLRLAAAYQRAGADERAVESLREAYALGGGNDVLQSLDDIFGRLGRYEEQAEVLDRLFDASGDLAFAVRRGDALSSAGRLEAAVAAYGDVLALHPGHAGAVVGLERLAHSPAVRAAAASLLERAYREQGNLAKRAQALELQLESADPKEARPLMIELAALRESLGQVDLAFALRRRLFSEAPADEQARAELERVAERAGRLAELVEAYEDVLERMEREPGPVAGVLLRRVAWLREKLGQPFLARDAWERIIHLEPSNPEPHRALADIYRRAQNHEHLVQALLKLAELEVGVDAQVDRLFEVAQIAEETLGDRALAASAYRRVLERQPEDKGALKSLHALFDSSGQWAELAPIIEREIALSRRTGQLDEVVELMLELAHLKLERLSDRAGAFELFRSVLQEVGPVAGAVEGLEALALSEGPFRAEAAACIEPVLERAGQHARRVKVLESHAEGAPTPEQRAALLLTAAEVTAGPLGDPFAALLNAGRALRCEPENQRALESCLSLAERAEALEELCALLEEVAPQAGAAAARARLFRVLARSQEKIGDGAGAIGSWRHVLEELPADVEALRRLEALLEQHRRWAELVSLLELYLPSATEPHARVALLRRIAQAKEAGGDDAGAIEALRSAFAVEPSTDLLLALDRILARAGRHAEQAEVLERLALLAEEAIERKDYLARYGRALLAAGDYARAVDAFAQVLSLAAADPAAIEGLEQLLEQPESRHRAALLLEPIHRGRGDDRKLVSVLEMQLPGLRMEERPRVLKEITRLRESLGDKHLAFAATAAAFACSPDDETRRELERLAESTGSYVELADEYRAQLERGPDGTLALELWRRLAVLYETKLSRKDLAAAAYEQVLKRAGDDKDTLSALARLYREEKDFKALAAVVERQVSIEPTAEGQAALLLELAQLHDERLGDKAMAARFCREVLRRRPDHTDAAELLGTLLFEAERFDELASLFEERIASGPPNEPDLQIRLASLLARQLDRPGRALDLVEEVLRERRGDERALRVAEEVMRRKGPASARAAALLEPFYEASGRHRELVEALETRAAAEASRSARAALLQRIAEVHEGPLRDAERAYDAASRALRDEPGDPALLDRCIRLATAASKLNELAELLGAVAADAEVASARALTRARARALETVGRRREAIEAWSSLLGQLAEEIEPLQHLAVLLETEARWAELVEVLERLAQKMAPPARAGLLQRVAQLKEERLGDLEGALDAARRQAELEPDSNGALERMDRLCTALSRWPELAAVLERRIERERGDATPLLFRLAQIRDGRLGDRAGAIPLYIRVLKRDASHRGARSRLEEIWAEEPTRIDVLEALMGAYRAAHALDPLAVALERRAAVERDVAARRELLFELADVRIQQDEAGLAFLAVLRAFEDEPSDPRVRGKLEILAEGAGMHDALAEAYDAALDRVPPPLGAELCLHLGALYEESLGDEAEAIRFFARARELDGSAEAEALAALARLHERGGRWEELISVLEAQARAASGTRKIELLSRIGQLAEEKLGDLFRAAGAFERVLEADPSSLDAARTLERLYESSGQPARLFDALGRLRRLLAGPERDEVTIKMAEVAQGPLGDPEAAIGLCREVLSSNVRHERAFELLEALLGRTGKHRELEELLQARLLRTLEPMQLAKLHRSLGRLLWRVLERPEVAAQHLRAAIERDPRNAETLAELAELYESLKKPFELAETLRRLIPLSSPEKARACRVRLAELCLSAGRRQEALEVARAALEARPELAELERLRSVFVALDAKLDAARALELFAEAELARGASPIDTLLEIGELRRKSSRPLSAAWAYEKVLELEPGHRGAFDAARRLYAEQKSWPAYVKLVQRFMPYFADAERKAELLAMARIQAEWLGDESAALETLFEALRGAPSDEALLSRAKELAARTKNQEALALTLERIADALPRNEVAARLYLRLAELFDKGLDDPKGARSALEHILEFDPLHAGALEALCALHRNRKDWRAYVEALDRKREVATDDGERVALNLEAARVFEAHLSDVRAAAAALTRAIDVKPDEQTVRLLFELHRRHRQWAEAARALRLLLDQAAASADRARLQLEIGRLYEHDAKDLPSALSAYRLALDFDSSCIEALSALERLYTELDRPAELIRIHERLIELSSSVGERIERLFECARLWEDRLANPLKADACLEAVLRLDGKNLLAFAALERLRREQSRWADLIRAYEWHLTAVSDAVAQSDLWVQMGDVFREKLFDLDRAAEAYLRALELNGRCRPAMGALAALYEKRADWQKALQMLERESQLVGDKPEAAELHARAGRIWAVMLFDTVRAKQAYRKARQLDRSHLGAIRALKGIAEQEQDWATFERMLAEEAEHARGAERYRAVLELARFYEGRLKDAARAARWYDEALKLEPDSEEAAMARAELAFAEKDFATAARLLEIVTCEPARKGAEQELSHRLSRLGQALAKAGQKEKAVAALERAVEADPTQLAAREQLAEVLLELDRLDQARAVLEELLSRHKGQLSDMATVGYLCRLGEICATANEPEQAQRFFEKALAIAPSHHHALRALAHLHEQAGRFRQAAELRHKMSLALDGEQRFQACLELGRLAREKLSDLPLAIDAYHRALRVKPDALVVLDALQGIYRESRQLTQAARTLEAMAHHPELAKDVERKKRVLYDLGQVTGVEMGEVDRAVAAFSAALELDPRFDEAYAAAESLLKAHRRPSQLEQLYVRAIERLSPEKDGARRAALMRSLGELRASSGRPEGALEAFLGAKAASPNDPALDESIGLIALKLGKDDVALASLRRALSSAREPAKVVSALSELYARRKDYDAAYLAARAAEGLFGQIDAGQKEILEKLTPFAKRRDMARVPLSDRMWRATLLHAGARGLAELLSLLFEHASKAFAADHDEYCVHRRKHRIELKAQPDRAPWRELAYVARLLKLEEIELYSPFVAAQAEPPHRRPSQPPDASLLVELCQTHPLSLKLGGRAFTEMDPKDLLAHLAFFLALARPELAWARRIDRPALEALVQAAIALVTDRFDFTADPKDLRRERRLLEKSLSSAAHVALGTVVRRYLERARPDDVKGFHQAAELSALRAALLVTGDALAVRRALLEGRGVLTAVSPQLGARELLSFALGGELSELRRAIGTQIEVTVS